MFFEGNIFLEEAPVSKGLYFVEITEKFCYNKGIRQPVLEKRKG